MLATCLQLARYSGTATVLPQRGSGATNAYQKGLWRTWPQSHFPVATRTTRLQAAVAR